MGVIEGDTRSVDYSSDELFSKFWAPYGTVILGTTQMYPTGFRVLHRMAIFHR